MVQCAGTEALMLHADITGPRRTDGVITSELRFVSGFRRFYNIINIANPDIERGYRK